MTQDQLPMVAMPSMNDTHLEEMIIINKLENAVKESDVAAVTDILKELHEHTAIHFFEEEEMMEEALFPAFATHKAEHDRHLHELQSLRKYFDENQDPKAITAYIEGNLVNWLIHHINTMDSMTAQYLQQGLTTGCEATKGCTTGNC
ncbi:MAG: hemerythrin family protein [Campylobacterota bacterium]